MVGKSGIGVERFVDFHLHVEKLIRYHVPSHHTAISVPLFRAPPFFPFFSVAFLDHNVPFQEHNYAEKVWNFTAVKNELLKRC